MKIEARLQQLGLVLPDPPVVPPGIGISFEWVRVRGDRAYVSGHGALEQNGKPAGPFGKVEVAVSVEEARQSARCAALAVLSSLQRTLGDLDRVTAWLTVQGFVNARAGSIQTTNVVNGFSDLVLEIFGHEIGSHARFAIGVEALPLDLCVTIGAEVQIHS